jgi:hypothetical protein
MQAGTECVALTGEIGTTMPRAAVARARQQRWERGFLFKRIRKAKFAQLCEEAVTAEAQLSELQEQLKLARLATEITVEPDIAVSYSRLCDAFAAIPGGPRRSACTSPPPDLSASIRAAVTASSPTFRTSVPRVSTKAKTFAIREPSPRSAGA